MASDDGAGQRARRMEDNDFAAPDRAFEKAPLEHEDPVAGLHRWRHRVPRHREGLDDKRLQQEYRHRHDGDEDTELRQKRTGSTVLRMVDPGLRREGRRLAEEAGRGLPGADRSQLRRRIVALERCPAHQATRLSSSFRPSLSPSASSSNATPKSAPFPLVRFQLTAPPTLRQIRAAPTSASSRNGPSSVAPVATTALASGSTQRTPRSLRSTRPALSVV